jgi:GNAT superfamily N-acetyltransferase
MRFRDAKPEDSFAMSRVMIESIACLCHLDHRGDNAILERWTANKAPENLARWLTNPSSHMYVIEDEGEGEVLSVGAFSDAGEIQLNYVAPKARFRGVSKTMLERLEDEMRERGIRDARLNSTATAHRFYLSAGWADRADGGNTPVGMEVFGMRAYPMMKTLY